MSAKLNNIAVLIDADNASANNIGQVLQEIEKYGTITCKKIYGDWGNAHIKSWQEALLKYAIDPMQQFAYVKGKNATDIGLVIDAMDMLYSDKYDGFCLISSDSDFTALALRIRKNHVKVFGFGKHITVNAFTQACDIFCYVGDLLPSIASKPITQNINTKGLIQNAAKTSKSLSVSKIIPFAVNDTSTRWTTKQLKAQTYLIRTLNDLIVQDPKSNKGWSHLSYIASQIKQRHTDIHLNKYGYKKFSDLMVAIGLYDVRTIGKTPSIKINNQQKSSPIVLSNDAKDLIKEWDGKRLKCDTKLLKSLRASIIDHPKAEEDQWVNFALVGNEIKKHYSAFDPKCYGYSKLAEIIKNIDLFETKIISSTLYVRHKAS